MISSLSVLHSPEYTKRFTELSREEKGEGEDRGDLGEKKESKGETASWPLINFLCALHSLEHPDRFTELHREGEREEGDRGDQEENRGSEKERDQSSQ